MTLYSDAKIVSSMPIAASALGFGGLIPFVAGAFAVCFLPELKAPAAAALLVYGAVILSFLGGIRWGFAVIEGDGASWGAYGLSVVPSLVGWIAVLVAGPVGLLLLAIALTLWFFAERTSPPTIPLPGWYPRLRGILTAIAALSLISAAISW